jgi:hypothetical protein
MNTATIKTNPWSMDLSFTDERQEIINHKQIADHLLAAAANHFKAANHLKDGNYEKAAQCAMSAKEYLNLASSAKVENINSFTQIR